MKRRFIVAMLLIFALLIGLCSCGNGEKKSKDTIKDDILEAYELDAAGKKLVRDLFAEFDGAMAKLKKSKVEDQDFFNYAEAVFTAFSGFLNSFPGDYYKNLEAKMDNTTDKDLKAGLAAISNAFASLAGSGAMGYLDIADGYDGETGERLAEDAFNFVNEVSDFFYGVDRITDEDLDALA